MNDDDWGEEDIAKQCAELKFKLDLANGAIQILEDKCSERRKECDDLKETLYSVNAKVDELEKNIGESKKNLNDETSLFNTSEVFKRISFRLWLHDTYHRLVDSDSPNPQIDLYTISEELRKFYTPEKLSRGPQTFVRRAIRREEEYISRLNHLHCQINAWVKRVIADHENLTLEQLGLFLDRLRGFSRMGQKTFDQFRPDMNVDHNRSFHQKLYKHFMSLIIHERVLSCFAFRMDAITSKQLYAIENAILTSGRPGLACNADNRCTI